MHLYLLLYDVSSHHSTLVARRMLSGAADGELRLWSMDDSGAAAVRKHRISCSCRSSVVKMGITCHI